MRRLTLIALLALAGCVENQVLVPPTERAALERQLSGAERYLKLSFFEMPFFGDETRRLLTPVQSEEVRLLDNPDGTPINPGAPKAIFPVGTRARIKGIEFPTPLA